MWRRLLPRARVDFAFDAPEPDWQLQVDAGDKRHPGSTDTGMVELWFVRSSAPEMQAKMAMCLLHSLPSLLRIITQATMTRMMAEGSYSEVSWLLGVF